MQNEKLFLLVEEVTVGLKLGKNTKRRVGEYDQNASYLWNHV